MYMLYSKEKNDNEKLVINRMGDNSHRKRDQSLNREQS